MRQELLGLPIDVLTMEETINRIESMIDEGGVHQHVVLNAAKVVEAQRDSSLRAAIEDSDLINADGMSIVWAGRLLGVPIPERVTGIDLFERLLEASSARGWRPYFLGARADVVERTVHSAQTRYPSLEVAGFRDGYWAPGDDLAVANTIAQTSPDLLFVALPSPMKEEFINRHKRRMGVPFVMGVGGSFDVLAGTTRRAPWWMQRTGLEWLFRLLQEPRRMFMRYLVGNSKLILLTGRELLRAGARNR